MFIFDKEENDELGMINAELKKDSYIHHSAFSIHHLKQMPDCKQYGGITRTELDHLRKDLEAEGVIVPEGDDVPVKGPYKIELRATYDEAKETLKICITEKPFYIPESEIWKIVDTATAPYANEN